MTAGWSPCIHLNTATNTPYTEFTTVNPLAFIKQLFRQARRRCQESWYETNFPTVKLMIAHFWRNNSSFDMKTWHARDCDAVTSCEQTITNFTFYLKYPDRINRVHQFEAWHWSGYVQAVSFSTLLLYNSSCWRISAIWIIWHECTDPDSQNKYTAFNIWALICKHRISVAIVLSSL